MYFYRTQTPLERILFGVICGVMVISGACLPLVTLLFTEPDLVTAGIICEAIIAVCFAVSLFFYLVMRNQYRLKFLKLGKDYKQQVEKAFKHFEMCDDKFKKQLTLDCKKSYRCLGTVLKFNDSNFDEKIYKDKELKQLLETMIGNLVQCIENGSGWNGFIANCDADKYFYERKNYDDVLINDSLDGWEVLCLIGGPLVSCEFRYLANCVFKLTDFTLNDNGLSDEYTVKLNEQKAKLERNLNPSLATFYDELCALKKRLENSAKNG